MLKLAILDMNAGVANQGLRCIRLIAEQFAKEIEIEIFDVRANGELPDDSHDIYISSGGPGSPLASGEMWEREYFSLLDKLWEINQQTEDPAKKKYFFFICFSFQLATRYFSSGNITERRSMSFGTFPVHSSNEGDVDELFQGLDDPFYVADFRNFQAVNPSYSSLGAIGASVLAYEKVRENVPYERAIMAIRWSKEWVGTQFHPEADSAGMIIYFNDPERREIIIDEHGLEKFQQMMNDLQDESKIDKTNKIMIPGFLRRSIDALSGQQSPSQSN